MEIVSEVAFHCNISDARSPQPRPGLSAGLSTQQPAINHMRDFELKTICVLGLGYIGLPMAAMFATHGLNVTGVDVNAKIVALLNNGEIHIKERGLKTLVQTALLSGNLSVREQPVAADGFIIAVPTPLIAAPEESTQNNSSNDSSVPRADLSFIRAASRAIAPFLRLGNLVVLESTSPPGTTLQTVVPILEESGLKAGEDFYVVYCPERVLPGRILEELVKNDRIIGGINPDSAERARRLYASFVEGQMVLTDATTAEIVKLMENTYRDVNIALANELALVAERIGIDVWQAIEMANRHPRVNIHQPGPGVGGHCIAVDPWFIVAAAPEITPLIQTARRINDAMPAHVVELVKRATSKIEKPVIACLGIAYKANVADIRESPALAVVHLLQEVGFEVRAYDPHVPAGVVRGQEYSLEAAITGADCLVVLTDHSEFQQLASSQIPLPKIVIDTRKTFTGVLPENAGIGFKRLGAG
jgi:UDP-N-acetyl-D-mannosaminuronic acid dehydrogenase